MANGEFLIHNSKLLIHYSPLFTIRMSELRNLPSVDKLLQTGKAAGLVLAYGRPLLLEALRAALQQARTTFHQTGKLPAETILLENAENFLQSRRAKGVVKGGGQIQQDQ